MKILLTGKNGQVGWELQRTLCIWGDVVALGSAELDLADPDAIVRTVREIRPDFIVNPAAYTAVDKAESDPELAMAINGTAPGILAEEAKRSGAMLIHYSTDYVFDGSKSGAYLESDAPHPLNVYGRSKLAGELAIAATGCRYVTLRTSWVYGARGKNFLLTMLRLLRERDYVSVVEDQCGAPTWSRLIAEATAGIMARRSDVEQGLYHLTSSGQTTWLGFASAIATRIVERGGKVADIRAIPAAEYPTPTQRPANSVLSCERLRKDFGIAMPEWEGVLNLLVAELLQ